MIRKLISRVNACFAFLLLIATASPLWVWANTDQDSPRRIKNIAFVKGDRENALLGYGIVVGLKGTGDSSTEIAVQSLSRLFSKLGLELHNTAQLKTKNTAAVIVTGNLPSFARAGKVIDCTVSSIGDSSSLEGGTLLVTPLKAGDENVYAIAQGTLSQGGRITNCASIEKEIPHHFTKKTSLRLQLHHPDYTTANRMTAVINAELGGKYAFAPDKATVDLIVPPDFEGNTVRLMSLVENFVINVDSKARVVLNEKTGTVVIGSDVQIMPIAISHGDLSIEIKGAPKGTKPQRIVEVKSAGNVSDLIQSLNLLGVGPKDLIAIFQTLKESGALTAELQIL
jgi:flagellar P-ring protein precursor FlgI